jgi:serine/threonine protein kinase
VYHGLWGKHQVALKVIDVEQAQKKLYGTFEEHNAPTLEQLSEAMQWEVLSLSSVNHPNLVTFYGIYQHQSERATYLVMEYCAGGTLQDILKHPVPWSKLWQWALVITHGIAAIHEQGLLHRDLKAENVLLYHRYCAKLGDLGVAQMDALLQDSEAEVVAKGLHDNRLLRRKIYTIPP